MSRAEVAFDHQSLDWLAGRHAHNDELRETSPVVWNPEYGGFWYVTGYEEVATVARDSATFTPRYERGGGSDGLEYIGIMGIPRDEEIPPIGIAEADSVRHQALRRLINPFLLPPAVAADRPFIEQATTWFLDQKIAEGAMDMVLDVTNPVPAVWTMKMLELPYDRWEYYAELFHATAAYGQDMPEYQQAVAKTPEMFAELLAIAAERRKKPGTDMFSQLVTLEVEGERLSDDDVIGVLWNLIGGGLDTTTSLTSLALAHLDQDHDLRQRLVDDPSLILPACEEYLRWTSVNETLTRTCTTDTVLGGQEIRRGDFVMMSWLGANYDPAVFECPHQVDVDRTPNAHLAFGVGTHRCIGLHSARALFEIMMREILTRVPDYVVDRDATRFYQGNPELYGVVTMPVTFTPGEVVGVDRPF